MTINSETVKREGNQGDHRYVIVELDITSLDSAGTEPYDPATQIGLDGVEGAQVLDQENQGYKFGFDADNTDIIVKYADYDASSDGVLIDVPDNTDVGTVTLKFEGDYAA